MRRKVGQIVGIVLIVIMGLGYLMLLTTVVSKADSQDCECLGEHEHDQGGDAAQCGDCDECDNVNSDNLDNCAFDEMEQYGFSCSSSSSASGNIMKKMAVCSKHANFTWVTIKAATCSSAGTEAYTCPVCKFAYPNRPVRTIPKNDKHTWNRTAASCTIDKKCTLCGKVDQKAKGHTYAWRDTVKPGCTTSGKSERYCTRSGCGYVVERKDLPAYGHNWGDWITEKSATCTTTGSRYHICKDCKTKESENIGKLVHDEKGALKTVQATCTCEGYTVATCSMCGSEQGSRTPLSKTDHKWSLTSAVDSTCSKTGTKNYKCTQCNQTKSDEIPKKDHICVWQTTKEATCTEKGERVLKCSCGYISKIEPIDKIDHTCKWKETRKATCAKAGLAEYICVKCGASTNWDSIEYYGDHTWNRFQATCTEDKICEVCGIVGEKAPGYHSWNRESATCTEDKKCEKCGTVGEKAIGHICSWNITEPTCTEDGRDEYKCVCGYVQASRTTSSSGHDMITDSIKYSSCTEDGFVIYKCSHDGCSYKEKKTLPATGHHMEWKEYPPVNGCSSGVYLHKCTNLIHVTDEDGNDKEVECDYAIDGRSIQAYEGHVYDRKTKYKSPTVYSEGEETWECKCGAVKTVPVHFSLEIIYSAQGNESKVEFYNSEEEKDIIGDKHLIDWIPTPPDVCLSFLGWSTSNRLGNRIYTSENTIGDILHDIKLSSENTLSLEAVWIPNDQHPVFPNESKVLDLRKSKGAVCAILLSQKDTANIWNEFSSHNSDYSEKEPCFDGPIEALKGVMYYYNLGFDFDKLKSQIMSVCRPEGYTPNGIVLIVYKNPIRYEFCALESNWFSTEYDVDKWVLLDSFRQMPMELIEVAALDKVDSFVRIKEIPEDYGLEQTSFRENDEVISYFCKLATRYESKVRLVLLDRGIDLPKVGLQDILLKDFHEGICGPISALNVYYYMSEQYEVSCEDVIRDLKEYYDDEDRAIDWLTRLISGGDGWGSIANYLLGKRLGIKSAGAGCFQLGRIVGENLLLDGYEDIKNMLSDNIPVIMAYQGENLYFYSEDLKTCKTADSHFFVATGLYENADKTSIYLKIATTWGKELYIDWYEYVEKANHGIEGRVGCSYLNIIKTNSLYPAMTVLEE